jgi:hypothetical protein
MREQSTSGMILGRETEELRKILSHFVHYKIHMDCPGIQPRLL